MTLLLYSTESRMALAEDPFFPSEAEAEVSTFAETDYLTLQEWRTYFVKFYGDEVPSFFPRPGSDFVLRMFPNKIFEIGFKNVVGKTRIGPVRVRVESRKISETLYEVMLDDIAAKFANLVFSFKTPLGQSYRKKKAGRDIAYVEYLFLKKYLLDSTPNLDGITALILANPHNRISREFRRNSIDVFSETAPAMLVRLFTASESFGVLRFGHPLLSTACGRAFQTSTGRRLYPAEAAEEQKRHTVDTNENRFVKNFIQSVQRRLNDLKTDLRGDGSNYLNPDIETHLDAMERKIGLFLSDPFWSDVGSMRLIPAGSQVLQRRDGYRQLFSLYSLLQLTTHCSFDEGDFKNLLETKDTPTLFEYWCFFVVKSILDKLKKSRSYKILVLNDALEQKIVSGICLEYEDGISLWFNRTSSGSPGIMSAEYPEDVITNESYSHTLRPDIVISRGNDFLIFDAKFKGQRGGFYGEEDDGTISTWKEEDIDKMHTYREAIRNVSGAFILYPGKEARIYPAHDAAGLCQSVGALPLKPDDSAFPNRRQLEALEQIIAEFTREV